MNNIGPQNLVAILSHVSASAVAQVGPNATTTTVPLIGADLTQADFTGGFAMFDAGALGTNSPPTLAPIASNTATSLTFAAGVLSSAPQAGSNVWLYRPQVFNVQVTAPENVAQWGGAAVEAADATGVVPFRLPYSEATPGAAAPARAVQVAGTDGTDLRALKTDADGTLQGDVTKVGGTAVPSRAGTPVVPTGPTPYAGALADASGTTSATAGTSTQALAAGLVTRYLFIENVSTTSGDYLWVNFGAAATAGAGSLLLGPGSALVFEDSMVPTQAVNVLSNVASLPFTLKYA